MPLNFDGRIMTELETAGKVQGNWRVSRVILSISHLLVFYVNRFSGL